jgi:hypothetical protein
MKSPNWRLALVTAADQILRHGFRDAIGSYGLVNFEQTGVWLGDSPMDINEGASTAAVAALRCRRTAARPCCSSCWMCWSQPHRPFLVWWVASVVRPASMHTAQTGTMEP